MYTKTGWYSTLVVFFIGLVITLTYFTSISSTDHTSVLGVKTYTAPTSFSAKPSMPDFRQNEGGVIKRDRASVIVFSGTTDSDAYLSLGITPMTEPIKLCSRYQVSPVYEMWFKSQVNDAKFLYPLRTSLVSIKFTADDLLTDTGDYFPMDSLKIAYSPDGGYSWSTLRTSVVDTENMTVSAISRVNGGFMLIAGYAHPDSYCNYKQTN